MSNRTFISVKNDIIFRLFFADERNEEFLIGFLKSVLELSDDDYNQIEIADPHLLREWTGDKLAIIDVKLYTKSRKVIHIEIQLKVTEELKNRIVLYDSKLIAEQIGSGDGYDTIKKVISIVIVDENLIKESPKYHHRFTLCDLEAGIEFSDVIEIHLLELRKLPANTDGTQLYDWSRFIAAESDEELEKIAQTNPEVKKAVIKFRELTADERTRDMFERQEKARRDQAMFERRARQEGRQEGTFERNIEIARNMIADRESIKKIMRYTGLSTEEIGRLKGEESCD